MGMIESQPGLHYEFYFSKASRPSMICPIALHQKGGLRLIEWLIGKESLQTHPDLTGELSATGPRTFSSASNLPELLDRHRTLEPGLFIFQISRCGSTLAARMLARDPANRVYNEPPLLGLPVAWQFPDFPRDALRAHGFAPVGAEQNLIIKFNSLNLFRLPQIRKWFPDTPCWLILREPRDVLASNLKRPAPAFVNPAKRPEIARLIGDKDTSFCEADYPEAMARILGKKLEFAEQHLDSFDQILDYHHFPRQLLDACAPWTKNPIEETDSILSRHSKHSDRGFSPDPETERIAESQEVHTVSALYCDEPWHRIQSRL